MTTLKRWPAAAVCCTALIVPAALWASTLGNPLIYLHHDVPPGQALYVISKLFGLLALSLFWFQALAALARGVPQLGFLQLGRETHRRLGLTLFALALAHACLFFAAASLRSGHLALGLLTLRFDNGFFAFYTTLGLIALLLFPLGIAAGFLRARFSSLRWLHRVWAVAFVLVFLHGMNIGTETRLGLMFYVYVFMAVSLGATAILRILVGWRSGYRRRSVHGARRQSAAATDGAAKGRAAWLFVLAVGAAGSLNVPVSRAETLPHGLLLSGLTGGEWRLYASTGDARGLHIIPTTAEPRTPAISPSGDRIAYVDVAGNLREYRVEDQTTKVRIESSPKRGITQPAYDGAGRLLAVSLKNGNSIDTDIVAVDAEGGFRTLLPQRSAQFEPAAAADGAILYGNVHCTVACGRVIQEIWRYRASVGRAEQLTLLNAVSRQPYAGPDGAVYFSSNAAGSYHIWRLRPDEDHPEEITGGNVVDAWPVVTAGRDVYFIRHTPEGVSLMQIEHGSRAATRVALPIQFDNLKDLRLSRCASRC